MSEQDNKSIFSLASELTSFCSPTGFEDEIRKYLLARLKKSCDVETDVMGNVIARVKGTGKEPRPRLLLAAHIDEIGFMVSHVTPEGFLRVAPLGGQNNRILLGQRVVILGKQGHVKGVIGEKPVHLLSDEDLKRPVKDEDILVDVGATSKEQALDLVSIGDAVTFEPQCTWLGAGDVFSCKAGDDRLGVLVQLLCIEYLARTPPAWDVIGVFSTQEEIGVRGITPSAFAADPAAAIVLEVAHATDYPGISRDKYGEIGLGKGPAIRIGPNMHPRLTKFIMNVADELHIPFQVVVQNKPTGTDGHMQESAGIFSRCSSEPDVRLSPHPAQAPLLYTEAPVGLLAFFNGHVLPDACSNNHLSQGRTGSYGCALLATSTIAP